MEENIINILEKEVKKRCESSNNFFGIGAYYHIKAVVENAIYLAEKNKADIEIVTISAWLHDIASVTDYDLYEQHNIHGANIAEELLLKLNYSKEKIELVKNCILNHRGSDLKEKYTKEEICVADADSISHFDNIPLLLYLAYAKKGYSFEEGIEFVKNKLDRSFNKLSEDSKIVYKEKYENVMKILN